ncbi:hypothetical protein tb265_28510 [Gemmatimonadetes bacterium T265]|nr:hypothetical protein tb265_28510 [Gemmatimonadetes bacterium T265]
MTGWIFAALVGVVVGLAGYAPALRRRAAFGWLAAARALAVALVAAVAIGARVAGRPRTDAIVALDASASWTRGADPTAARAAADSAGRLASRAGVRLAATGESLRAAGPVTPDLRPSDRASRVGALAESAATTGLPFVLVTDGEVDDPDAVARAPVGSRVVVVRPARRADAAVVRLDAPETLAPGDTATVTITVGADSAGAGAGRIGVRLDASPTVERALPALPGFGRTTFTVRLPIPADARAHTAVLSAFVSSAGDGDARNDTASRALDVNAVPRAVVVSTAPDYDVGLALAVLRGAFAVPVRAYYRVAPGAWRVAGTLAPAREADVRAAAAGARVLVLHGDTAALGDPRTLGRGALMLIPAGAPGDSATDWYAGPATAPGPLAVLAGLPWDSLPPVEIPGTGGDARTALGRVGERWTGVVARAGRRGPARAIIAGGVDAAGRHLAVVAAGGFWRWAFRGGAGASAAPAVWGAVFDWLADEAPGAARAIAPADAFVRSGARVRWRGVVRTDTVTHVRVTPRAGGAPTTLALRRDAESGEFRSDSPAPGVYDVSGGGGLLVVNASAELLPRAAALRSGPIGGALGEAPAPAVPISPGWPLAAATLLLCAEWVARRRLGLR